MTDEDRLLAAQEIWDLIKAGRLPLAALYEFERTAQTRIRNRRDTDVDELADRPVP